MQWRSLGDTSQSVGAGSEDGECRVIRPRNERLCCGVLRTIVALSVAACTGGGSQNPVSSGRANGASDSIAPDPRTATLNWTPALRNTDGTALTNLAGYKVYFGTSSNALSTVVVVSNPSLTTYQVTNLSSGKWYFAVAAYTNTGTEGVLSNVASKAVQ